jgi:hypothetical protein
VEPTAEEPTRDPAREFASAYLAKPAGQAPAPPPSAKPAAPSALTPARMGIAAGVLLALALGGWLYWRNVQQQNQVACQAALLQGQAATDEGEFDKAATAAASAHGVCSGDSEALLAALETRISTGRALAKTCDAATAQARQALRGGRPKAALAILDPLHTDCAAWPGFAELEALPANASAQARSLVQQIGPLLSSGAVEDAQALAVQAERMDAEAEGLAELQSRIARQLGEPVAK